MATKITNLVQVCSPRLPVISEVLDHGGEVICKPWVPRNGDRFTKADFEIARFDEFALDEPA